MCEQLTPELSMASQVIWIEQDEKQVLFVVCYIAGGDDNRRHNGLECLHLHELVASRLQSEAGTAVLHFRHLRHQTMAACVARAPLSRSARAGNRALPTMYLGTFERLACCTETITNQSASMCRAVLSYKKSRSYLQQIQTYLGMVPSFNTK